MATGTRDPRPTQTRGASPTLALHPTPSASLVQRARAESEHELYANQRKPRAVQLSGSWPAARALFLRCGLAKKALGGHGAPQLAAVTERVCGTMSWAATSRHRF